MKNIDDFKKPSGHIGMILHKGGEYDNKTGTIKGGQIIKTVEFKNLIVNTASILMAMRMAPGESQNMNEGSFIDNGLQYLAVGTIADPETGIMKNGEKIDWMQQPAATVEQKELENEICRKKFTSWTFIDDNGNASVNPTGILRLVTTFDENEAIGPLTEMGIFGGDATDTKDSGYLFNYKTFKVWNKPNDSRLTITWKLTF